MGGGGVIHLVGGGSNPVNVNGERTDKDEPTNDTTSWERSCWRQVFGHPGSCNVLSPVAPISFLFATFSHIAEQRNRTHTPIEATSSECHFCPLILPAFGVRFPRPSRSYVFNKLANASNGIQQGSSASNRNQNASKHIACKHRPFCSVELNVLPRIRGQRRPRAPRRRNTIVKFPNAPVPIWVSASGPAWY